jgi:hypothetical protein
VLIRRARVRSAFFVKSRFKRMKLKFILVNLEIRLKIANLSFQDFSKMTVIFKYYKCVNAITLAGVKFPCFQDPSFKNQISMFLGIKPKSFQSPEFVSQNFRKLFCRFTLLRPEILEISKDS